MSAIEEYREVGRYFIHGTAVREYADAAIAEMETENERSRLVIVLLRLAAENVLRGGRRFPPRAEWRELHKAASGASRYLDDTWDDNLPPLDDISGEVVGRVERIAP